MDTCLIIILIYRSLIIRKQLSIWWEDKFCSSSYHPRGIVLPPALPGDSGASSYHLSQTWATPNLGGSGVEERVDRENPWSGQGLLSQWSWVLAHISWLLPGCLLTAISRLYSFKALVGHLWPAKRSVENKWDKKQMRWDLTGRHNTQNIQLHSVQLWLLQNLSRSSPSFFFSFSLWRSRGSSLATDMVTRPLRH